MDKVEKKNRNNDEWCARIRVIKETMSACEQYLLSSFPYDIELNSSIASHCITYSCSDPNNKDLSESCQTQHDSRCNHCDLLSTFPVHIEKLFQELILAPNTSDLTLESQVEEWRYELDKAVEDIVYYK